MKIAILFFTLAVTLFAKPQTIVFAAGCFWGVEKHFEQMPGVIKAVSGYAGGNYNNPDYHTVLKYRHHTPKGIINHTESVKVVYDDSKISAQKLIKSFWEMHDPTQKNRQGNDVGNNYRSAIYYTTPEQKKAALETKVHYQKLLTKAGYGTITTEIKPLAKFWPAETYHQDYLKKNPSGYCPNHATGVKFTAQKQKSDVITPLGGKEILVITAPHCRFCEDFKFDVLDHYHGTLPLRTAEAKQLSGFKLDGPVNGTPTLLLIEDGKEVWRHVGYMDEKAFYKAIGAFKLGTKSEAFHVAFAKGTESRFCKRYEKFKHTGDGVFIDTISGDPLFDTRDRFNSGSGWLSFYKSIKGAVIEKEDNSYGMHRVEIVARKSGAHLGHVFNDAPGGKRRYCINATVLEFVPRNKLKK